jgi:hypothetical protein
MKADEPMMLLLVLGIQAQNPRSEGVQRTECGSAGSVAGGEWSNES